VDHPPLGDGVDRNRAEITVLGEPIEKATIEPRRTKNRPLTCQQRDLLPAESDGLHPPEQPAETCGHTESGLMSPVIGVSAKEVVELGSPLRQAFLPVELGHGQLVLVRFQDA
jgi:hypothetical protein